MMGATTRRSPGTRPGAVTREQVDREHHVSKSILPIGHPLTKQDLAGRSPFDVADQIIAFRQGWSGGLLMKEPDPDPDPDPDDPDPDDEDPDAADPESTLKVGDRTFKVSDLQTIMAREKRQGKKAGRSSLVKDLGFDSVEELKAALEAADSGAPPDPDLDPDDKGKTGKDDAATKAAAEATRKAREREAAADARVRRADLRSALTGAGVVKDDLDDAYAMLDRKVDSDYDEDDLDDEVEALKKRRPALFGEDPDDDDTEPKPKSRANLPTGTPRRKATQQTVFGAGGIARAEERFGKK